MACWFKERGVREIDPEIEIGKDRKMYFDK